MSLSAETFALVFFFLILGMTTMIIMILAKEWTEYKALQFWPKLRSTRTLDLESGLYLAKDLQELAWRVEQLEDHAALGLQLSGFIS
ncbi:Zinc fingerRING-type [Penicillium sp. IBT 31633x]|nr:Zinc fingerRING-type [Penicillium sp. IBT 31633x]